MILVVCVFACSGCCSDRNGSLVEMGGEDLGGALVKKKKKKLFM